MLFQLIYAIGVPIQRLSAGLRLDPAGSPFFSALAAVGLPDFVVAFLAEGRWLAG